MWIPVSGRRLASVQLSGLVALALAAGACTSAATPSPAPQTAAPSAAASAAGTPAPSYPKHFSIVTIAPVVISEAPLRAALDDLNAQGYTIGINSVEQVDLGVAGVVSGNFDLGYGSMVPTLAAAQKAVSAKYVVGRLNSQDELWAGPNVTKCADMNGRKVGISSPGATSALETVVYIGKECPGTTPNYLTMAASSDRRVALGAGQLDATPLSSVDGIVQAAAKNAVQIHRVVNYAQYFPQLKVTGIIASQNFLSTNPLAVRDFITALIKEYRKAHSDAAYLAQIMQKYAPKDVASDKAIQDALVKQVQGDFDVNGGLDEASLQYSIDFFADQGRINKGLKASDVGDFTQLKAVLDVLGKQ